MKVPRLSKMQPRLFLLGCCVILLYILCNVVFCKSVNALSVGDDVSSYFSSATVTGGIDYDPGGAEFQVELTISDNNLFKTDYTVLDNGGSAKYSESGVDATWKWQWRCGDHSGGMPVLEKAKSIAAKVVALDDNSVTIEVKLTMSKQQYPGKKYPQPIVGQIKVDRKTYKTTVTAKINNGEKGVLYTGEKVDPTLKVDVKGDASTPSDTKVQIIEFYIGSGTEYEDGIVDGSESVGDIDTICDYFRNSNKLGSTSSGDGKGVKDCSVLSEYGSSGSLSSGTHTYGKSHDLEDGDRIGQKYCTAIGIKPSSSSNSNWNISKAACRTIAKKPSVQVKDGSIFSQFGAETSLSKKSNGTFGSWVEYLVASNGPINGLSSGAYLNSQHGESTNCALSPLSIANSNCASGNNSIGDANIPISSEFTERIKNMFNRETGDGVLPDGTSINLSQGKCRYSKTEGMWVKVDSADNTYGCIPENGIRYSKVNGTAYLNGGNLEAAENEDISATTVIYAKDVRINGNYYLPSNLSKSYQIPQLVIVAENDIYISNNVTNLAALLVSTNGTIKTCSDTTTPSADQCTNQLNITGTIYSKNLNLSRTNGAGAGGDSGTPAEIIDLNPATYVWGQTQSTSHSYQVNDVYVKELAPKL